MPGRDGGRRKSKFPEWRKQAMHAVDDIAELDKPLATLSYRGEWGEKPSAIIYKFDQKIAKTGIRYHAKYWGRWAGFTIQVMNDHAEKVCALIDEL